ncbi:MAG: chloride channel protein [bacterium]
MSWLKSFHDNFRYRVAHAGALPQLTVLGVLSGLFATLVAVAFRLCIEAPLNLTLPSGSESFEALPPLYRFALPVVGFTLLGVLAAVLLKPDHRKTGVGHVVERLHQFQGKMPLRSILYQFFGGIAALVSGAPLGREGPAIHLGAGVSSLLGQQLKLPNNSLRVLVGCGVASAISASFNTPVAGVIFAMEVVLMEYTIVGFMPVMLAAIIGALGSRLVFGSEPAFSVPAFPLSSLWELPYFLFCGLILGIASSAMLLCFQRAQKLATLPTALRFSLAGFLTGALAITVPEILGVGYDTVELAMLGKLTFLALVIIAAAKLLASSMVAALGVPGGLIGPTFVVGACLGGALGLLGGQFNPTSESTSGIYAILGMAGMMGATLNAPLAALIAVLELTYNPNILLPGMLVIVIACLTTRSLTRLPGIFSLGLNLGRYASPVFQMLSRAGVASLMERNIYAPPRQLTWQEATNILQQKPGWIVIEEPGETLFAMRPADLARYLEGEDKSLWDADHPINLLEIPADRRQLEALSAEATLQEALVVMKQYNLRAVSICRVASPPQSAVVGIITREDIDNYYQ